MTSTTAAHTELEWIQPTWRERQFELRSQDRPVALLTFPKWYAMEARHIMGKDSWDIYQPRFFSQEVAIRQTGCELPFAKYLPEFWRSSGTLELPKGRRLSITCRIWKNRYEVTREDGSLVFVLDNKGLLRQAGKMMLEKGETETKEFPWLTGLVWYLQLLRRRHAAAAGAH